MTSVFGQQRAYVRAAQRATQLITRLATGMADQGGLDTSNAYPGDPIPTANRRRADIAEAFTATRDVKAINPTPGPIPDLLES